MKGWTEENQPERRTGARSFPDKPAYVAPPTPVLDAMHVEHPCDGKMVTHSNLIGAFLDWLSEQGIQLAKWESVPHESAFGREYQTDELLSIHEGPSKLLHRYFEVDDAAEERERRAILAALQVANGG